MRPLYLYCFCLLFMNTASGICAELSSEKDVEELHALSSGAINGTVWLETAIVHGAEVRAYIWGETEGELVLAGSSTSDEQGHYTLVLPEGEYLIQCRTDQAEDSFFIPLYSNGVCRWEQAEIIVVQAGDNLALNLNVGSFTEEQSLPVELSGVVRLRADLIQGMQGDPIPGIPVIVEKENESGTPVAAGYTDASGGFSLGDLPPGSYRLYLDIPGVNMLETHQFSVSEQGLSLNALDFFVDADEGIYTSDVLPETEGNSSETTTFIVYPNPASTELTIAGVSADDEIESIFFFKSNGKFIPVQLNESPKVLNLDIRQWEEGLYFYRLQMNGKQYSGSCIIQR